MKGLVNIINLNIMILVFIMLYLNKNKLIEFITYILNSLLFFKTSPLLILGEGIRFFFLLRGKGTGTERRIDDNSILLFLLTLLIIKNMNYLF